MQIEWMNPADLTPYAGNAKLHPHDQIEHLANSISMFGWTQPIVVDEHNVVVIGHGRLAAAKQLGMDKVPVVRRDDLTDDQTKALRIVDNRVAKSKTDRDLLAEELSSIMDIDMEQFGIDLDVEMDLRLFDDDDDDMRSSLQHNVFENQERMRFPSDNYYGFPTISSTKTVGEKMIRFCDWKEVKDPEHYIAHFYYDDYKFMSAWREPDKYIDRLRRFKAVVAPDFSLYTDFPVTLQILSCYRRQWCAAYWQSLGIDVIPDVVWGEKDSFKFCFDGIPKHSTVAVSTVGVKRDKEWNNETDSLFRDGYHEMIKRLEPTAILFYGDMIDGLEGNIIKIPSFYEEKRKVLNERVKSKNGKRQ